MLDLGRWTVWLAFISIPKLKLLTAADVQ